LIEDGFAEEDNLWTTEREPFESVVRRAGLVLDHIFSSDKKTCEWFHSICVYVGLHQSRIDISITAHSGIINGLLGKIGRDKYKLPTGGRSSNSLSNRVSIDDDDDL
jgi:hypothetical protein